MTDPKLDKEEARQGETGFGMRWVLIISVVAAIVAIGLLFGVLSG
ncbi:hypothetical protein [Henriciella litoralis]|nr:hypothetical protein [Henriciella litoralis]